MAMTGEVASLLTLLADRARAFAPRMTESLTGFQTETWKPGSSKDSWVRSPHVHVSLGSDLAQQLRATPEYEAVLGALHGDPVIGPQLDHVIYGPHGGVILQGAGVVEALVAKVLDPRSATSSEFAIDEFRATMSARMVSRTVVPLLGVTVDNEIDLGGITIGQLTDEDVIACLEHDAFALFPNSFGIASVATRGGFIVQSDVERVVRDPSDQAPTGFPRFLMLVT